MNNTHLVSKKDTYLMLLLVFYMMTIFNLIHPSTPEMLISKGSSDYMYGILFAFMSLGMFVASPFWGRKIDLHGTKSVFLVTVLIYGIGQMGFGFAQENIPMIIFRFISGLGSGGVFVVFATYISLSSTSDDRGKNLGYLMVSLGLGSAIGQLIGGYLGNIYNYQFMFFVQSICVSSIILIIYFTIKNKSNVIDEKHKGQKINYLKSKFTIILATEFTLVVGILLFATNLPYYLSDVMGMSPLQIGIANSLFGVVGVVSGLIIGTLINKFTARKMYLALLLIGIVFNFLMLMSASKFLIITSFTIFGFFLSMHKPVAQMLGLHEEKNHEGEVLGRLQSFNSLGMFAGSFAVGILYILNPMYPFYAGIIMIIVSFILYMIYYKGSKVNVI